MFWCVLALSGAAWCGDNRNGTVTVNGLVWLKDAGCFGFMNWDSALSRPKSLAHGQCGLTDKSKAGDWRLPTIDELRAIYSAKSQFKNVQPHNYWSSNLYGYDAFLRIKTAWSVNMYDGYSGGNSRVSNLNYVWPVRNVK